MALNDVNVANLCYDLLQTLSIKFLTKWWKATFREAWTGGGSQWKMSSVPLQYGVNLLPLTPTDMRYNFYMQVVRSANTSPLNTFVYAQILLASFKETDIDYNAAFSGDRIHSVQCSVQAVGQSNGFITGYNLWRCQKENKKPQMYPLCRQGVGDFNLTATVLGSRAVCIAGGLQLCEAQFGSRYNSQNGVTCPSTSCRAVEYCRR